MTGALGAGPARSGLTDAAFCLAVPAPIRPHKLAVTTNCATQLHAEARVLKLGRSPGLGDVTVCSFG